MKSSPNGKIFSTLKRHSKITIILAIIAIIPTIIFPIVLNCLGYVNSFCEAHPFFSGVMISCGVAVLSTFMVLGFAYINHDKKEQEYKEIFRQSEKWLRGITMFVLFYLAIHLASKAFWPIGIPEIGVPYAGIVDEPYAKLDFFKYISPQDIVLSLSVIFIIISIFLIAPYFIRKHKNIIKASLIISLALSFVFASCIYFYPSFVPSKSTEPSYLFSWDDVPGNDSKKLLKYLQTDHNVNWTKSAEISKSDDGKTIRISKDENSAEITIDEEEKKVTLKISNGRTHKLKVKKEEDKLIIYNASSEGDWRLFAFISMVSIILYLLFRKIAEIPKGIKDDFKELLLIFCFLPAIIVASLVLAGDELVRFPNVFGNIVVGLVLISGFATLMSIVTISFKQETVPFPLWNPIWLVSTFASLAAISGFCTLFLLLRDFFKIDIAIFGKALSFSVAIMIVILLYGFLYEKLQKYQFTEWWRRECKPIAMIVSILLITIVSAINPYYTLWVWVWEIPRKLFWIAAVLVIGFYLPWILGLYRFRKYIEYISVFTLRLPNWRYLFIWDNVPVNHSKRLLRYLKDDCKIDWVENAEICKSDDGKTIRISKDENSAEITIDEEEKKVTLKIGDGEPFDLDGEMKNGRLIRRHIPKKPLRFKRPKLPLPKYQGMVLVKAKTDPGSLKEVIKGLDGMEGVYQTMVVRGEYDVCLIVEGVDSYDIEKKILEIRKINGVANTTTLRDVREFFDREVK